jgi:hypothetical protein
MYLTETSKCRLLSKNILRKEVFRGPFRGVMREADLLMNY